MATPRSRNLGLSRYFWCSVAVHPRLSGERTAAIGTVPRVGAADRVRRWARTVWASPWLLVGIVIGVLLVCAWIGWAIHVWSEHSARQGLGVLVVWPAIAAVLALTSIPFVWAFRVIRAGAGSDDHAEAEHDSADGGEQKGPGSEAAAG